MSDSADAKPATKRRQASKSLTPRKQDGKLDIETNPEGPLNPRQEKFCLAYVHLGNGVAAYRQAYGTPATTKDGTLYKYVAEILALPKIKRRIAEIREAIADETVLKTAQIVNELALIATADPRGVFNPDGTLIPVQDLPRDMAAAIASVKVEEVWEWEGKGDKRKRVLAGYVREVKFWNKNDALDKAMRYLGLFEKDNRQRLPSWMDKVPRDQLKMMEKFLSGIVGGNSGVAAEPTTGGAARTSH